MATFCFSLHNSIKGNRDCHETIFSTVTNLMVLGCSLFRMSS